MEPTMLLHVFFLSCLFAACIAEICSQQHQEDSLATFVMLHTPGLEIGIGGLHPAGALFEKPTSTSKAYAAHLNFVRVLEELGIPYDTTIKSLNRTDKSDLVEMAAKALTYKNGTGTFTSDNLLNDEYKRKVLENLSNEELINVVLTRPTVVIDTSSGNTHYVIRHVEARPLMNAVFTRDQQITTVKGVVLGALNSPQRGQEVEFMEAIWKINKIPIVGRVTGKGKLEGGDFFVINPKLSMIGQGLRTNAIAIQQLLDQDLFGTEKVVVVVDEKDQSQDRMHLDTIFNVVKHGIAVVEENVLNAGSRSHYRRYVKEYTRDNRGKYTLTLDNFSFIEYLKSKMGWSLISVTEDEQLEYMINFLNVGQNRIISVHPDLEQRLRAAGIDDIDVTYLEYSGITSMYGAAHCNTQVFRCPQGGDRKGHTYKKEL